MWDSNEDETHVKPTSLLTSRNKADHDVINFFIVWILKKQAKVFLLRNSPTRFCDFLYSYSRAIFLGVASSAIWSFSTPLKKYGALVLKVRLAKIPICGVPGFDVSVSCIGHQYWCSIEWLIFEYLYKRRKSCFTTK